MSLSAFGKDYLLLGLRMEKLIPGYVDAYFGPSKLADTVKKEKKTSPKNLLKTTKINHIFDFHLFPLFFELFVFSFDLLPYYFVLGVSFTPDFQQKMKVKNDNFQFF